MNNKITFEVAKEFKGVGGDFYSYENGGRIRNIRRSSTSF